MGWREWFGLRPSMQDLASRIIGEFRKQGEEDWTFDTSEATLRNSQGAIVNLANIYREYSQSPRSGRAALLHKYSALSEMSQRSVPKLWELAARSIYPTVRSRFDRTVSQIEFRDRPDDWPVVVVWPWIDELEIRLVYDWGTHLTQISEDVADTWGQPLEAIRQRALQNLAALPKPTWHPIGDGVYELVTDHSYQESLLLVDKVIDQLPFRESVACVPSNRGVLLACDGNQSERLVAMIKEAIRRLETQAWPLAGTVLARRGGSWQELHPAGDAAVYASDLRRYSEAITYADQKKALEALHTKQGEDIFVATFSLFRRPNELAVRSWCTWAEGIHGLLPKTDFVVLGRQDEEGHADPLCISWDRAISTLGHYMKDGGEDPPRFYVKSGFTDAEWVALKDEEQS